MMIKKRIWFCLFSLMALSCSEKFESNIPSYPVNLELDLTFEDKALKEMYAHKNYIQGAPGLSVTDRTGFGGVLAYHGLNGTATDAYYAFDLACPYEAKASIHIEVNEDGIYAICPQCGSKYELIYGIGNPIEGPAMQSSFYLKRYNVIMNGNKIYIQN